MHLILKFWIFQGKGFLFRASSRCYWNFVPQIYLFLGFHILVEAHFFWLCDFLFLSLLLWQRYWHPILETNALSMLASPLLILGGCADR